MQQYIIYANLYKTLKMPDTENNSWILSMEICLAFCGIILSCINDNNIDLKLLAKEMNMTDEEFKTAFDNLTSRKEDSLTNLAKFLTALDIDVVINSKPRDPYIKPQGIFKKVV